MKIVFFDGHCGLCNHLVDWLIRRDKKSVLKFAPLQGPTARKLLPESPDPGGEVFTVLYLREGKIHDRSTAALLCLVDIGGPWKTAGAFLLLPKLLRDLIYNLVVRARYLLVSRLETCRIPLPEERLRILP